MATSDIFGRRPLEFGGAFAADSAHIILDLECQGTAGGAGLLVQQLNVQYQQPITRLYEVGTQFTYYVAGRPQGNATIARILGPGNVAPEFYSCLGDVCNANINDLCFCVKADCLSNPNPSDGMQIGLKNVVLQALGMSIQAQDMIINENLSIFFTALIADTATCPGIQATDVVPDCF